MPDNVKLTLHPDPALPPGSMAPGQAAAGPATPEQTKITDALGRTLTLRELDVLEEQDLIGMVGEPLCLNRLYMARALEACSVAAIDGNPVAFPLTKAELRACFKRLRRDGLEAVMLNGMSEREKREKERLAVAKK
ncbi:MAG: hypothetical protein ACHQRJ_25580 [Alphaproteobacteria bacterium]